MKLIERYFAEKKLKEIEFAMQSKKIADMAKALDIDLNDPEWLEMPFTEASQVMQVRLADMMKRIVELRRRR